MIAKDHPYFFVRELLDKYGEAVFNLSRYIYQEDSLFDERECLTVRGSELHLSWLDSVISALAPRQELAFHSAVTLKDRSWHVPMIDLAISDTIDERMADRIRRFVPRNVFLSMAFYWSGRSFHAYSIVLLSPKEWREFMGRLLLINPKGQRPLIDTRWIGHRLLGGFSSLRWTNNSGLYLGMPKRVPFPGLSTRGQLVSAH
jgi:hypothetical protein